MLDKYTVPIFKPPLRMAATLLQRTGLTADQVTVSGFAIGLLAALLIAAELYTAALVLLLLNRIADGIDGELARLKQSTDAGGFLDITLDFFFYALFPLSFAFANTEANALPAAVLITSFVGTGASFLAFSSKADKHAIEHPDFGYKGFYYINGLAEGTETVLCFALMCLLPNHFPLLAYGFAFICVITAINRVYFGYSTLKASAGRADNK